MIADQVREFVIRPVLQRLEPLIPYTQAAENLVLGTGLVETNYGAIDQLSPGPGPAYGFWQMEKPTYEDLWTNFIRPRAALRDALLGLIGGGVYRGIEELHGNDFYAAAMCRVHYLRAPAPMPGALDAAGLAGYWKLYYNTPMGRGTIDRALPYFKQAVSL